MDLALWTTTQQIKADAAATTAFKQADAATLARAYEACLLYTSDAADERSSVDLGGRRIIKKKRYITAYSEHDTETI